MLNSLYCLGIPQTQRLTTRANMSLHTLLLKSSMILIWVVVIYCFVCLSSVTKAQSIKADSLTVESHYKCPRKTVKRRSSVLGMCFSMWPDWAIFFMKLFCANVAQTFGNFGFFWKMSLGQLLAKILFIPTSGHTDTFEGSWDTFYKTKLLAVWSPVKLKHNIFSQPTSKEVPFILKYMYRSNKAKDQTVDAIYRVVVPGDVNKKERLLWTLVMVIVVF